MEKIFLASSFSDVSNLLTDFVGESVENKTVTFIPTASIVEKPDFFVKAAMKSFEKLGLILDILELTLHDNKEIKDTIERNDFLYISGGNTFYLLQEIKRKNAEEYIKKHIQNGKVYIGESAGSMILSPNIEYVRLMDNPKKGASDDYDGLNVIDFYPVPHYGNFPFKKKCEKIVELYSNLSLKTFSNNQAILIDGTNVKIKNK